MKALPVTHENTVYFITERSYHWSRDGQYLTKEDAVIHILNGQYEYSKVDEFGRRILVCIISETRSEPEKLGAVLNTNTV